MPIPPLVLLQNEREQETEKERREKTQRERSRKVVEREGERKSDPSPPHTVESGHHSLLYISK